jgi:serine phosphatase RsbU (regulator of sigma subunit)
MIGIENFSKQTTKQQLIIEEHNLLLEKKIEERTVELKTKNEIMLKELELARNIQNQLIPNRSPREFIFSLYSPMEMVGGDFFDFINFQNQNKIGIFISDVSGHGVPAAFITSMLKGTIHQSGDKINNPSELLLHINDALKNQTDGNFITAFYGIYDTSNKSFLYSSAGHNQPYVFNNNQADMLSGKKGIPLTTMSNEFLKSINKSYVNNEITLPSNSKLLLYTDGLTEATSKNDINIDFENSVMSNILMKNADKKSDEFIKTLFDKLIEFRGCLNFEDDVCLICMDIK